MAASRKKLLSLTNNALKIIASDGSFNSWMDGAKVTHFSDDTYRMKGELVVSKKHLNPQGTFSGGAITTFIDILTSTHLMAHRGDLVTFPILSVNLEVKFMSPALVGELVELNSLIVKPGKRLTFIAAELYNKSQNNKILAVGQHTLSIDPKAGGHQVKRIKEEEEEEGRAHKT